MFSYRSLPVNSKSLLISIQIVGIITLLLLPCISLAQATVDLGDSLITDLHVSFLDRGMRHYQDRVDVDGHAKRFDTNINVVYGNLIHRRQEFHIPGRGLPLRLFFTYNSGSFFSGRYGYGWQMNYNVRYVTNSENGNIIIVRPDDRTDIFVRQDDGTFRATYSVRDSLVALDVGYKLIVLNDRWNNNGDYAEYFFDAPEHHYVTTIMDRNNNTLSFTYDRSRHLTSITDASDRQVLLTYGDNLLTQITDPAGRNWTYSYDAKGDMILVTDPMGETVDYSYETECHDLLTITSPNGGVHTFTYNDDYAVITVTDPMGSQKYGFNYAWTGSGTTNVTDALGNVTTYTYDELDRVTAVTDALGGTLNRTWNDRFRLVDRTDANGNTTTFIYDERGNIIQKTDPMGNTTVTAWDLIFNKRISVQDANSNTTVFTRDQNGNLIGKTDPEGNTSTYTVDEFGQRTGTTDALGNITQYTYDNFGNRTGITDALGGTSTVTHDARGNMLTKSDARGNVTTYTYDELDRLLTMTDALGGVVRHTYDAEGNRLSRSDALNNTSDFEYNTLNQQTSRTNALGGVTAYAYDAMGNRTSVADANGNTTNVTYDALNRQATTTNPMGSVTTFGYDGVGNRTSVTDPNGNTKTYGYDGNNRLTSTSDALGGIETRVYDGVGNRISMTDPNGNTTLFTYCGNNRLTTITDALGGITSNDYDAQGNQIALTDANGDVKTYEYDALGRRTKITSPGGNTWEYQYDAAGNVIQRTDANGAVTSYTYDALNRRTKTIYLDGDVDWEYDAVGNLVRAKSNRGINDETLFQYDAIYRTTSKVVTYDETIGQRSITYTYDDGGNRTSMIHPDGEVTNYTYDAANRISDLTSFGGTSTYTYDASGNLTMMINPIGATTTTTYDAVGRPLTFISTNSAGEILQDREYSYDAAGNEINVNYYKRPTYRKLDYDGLNRIVQQTTGYVSESGQPLSTNTRTYTLDAIGRRLKEERSNGNVTTFAYNADGFLTEQVKPDHTYVYTVDNNGNRTSRTKVGGDETTYTFDYENRLETSYLSHYGLETFYYSPMGKRLKYTFLRTGYLPWSRHFVYDGSNQIETWEKEILDSRQVPRQYFEPGTESTKRRTFFLYDPLGSNAVDFSQTSSLSTMNKNHKSNMNNETQTNLDEYYAYRRLYGPFGEPGISEDWSNIFSNDPVFEGGQFNIHLLALDYSNRYFEVYTGWWINGDIPDPENEEGIVITDPTSILFDDETRQEREARLKREREILELQPQREQLTGDELLQKFLNFLVEQNKAHLLNNAENNKDQLREAFMAFLDSFPNGFQIPAMDGFLLMTAVMSADFTERAMLNNNSNFE